MAGGPLHLCRGVMQLRTHAADSRPQESSSGSLSLQQPLKACAASYYGSTRSGFSAAGAEVLLRAWPILRDALKIAPTGRKPASLCAATAASPIEAMHPHEAQSGFPPNWQGTILVSRSAEMVWVVCANTHSRGLCGGAANW